MVSTTLVTFLLQTPPQISTVELLGSWDNFTRPYRLERDTRLYRGHWRGCHSFTNIICDGETQNASPKRDGGLMMGGTYWYFYRLDGDVDFYDRTEPSTKSCPFLPGQVVNVLEVPDEGPMPDPQHDKSLANTLLSNVFTLDPRQKYRNPRPSYEQTQMAKGGFNDPATLAAHAHAGAHNYQHAIDGGMEKSEPLSLPKLPWMTAKERLNSSCRSLKQSSLMAAFRRMRGTKSIEYEPESKAATSLVNLKQGASKPVERATQSAHDKTPPYARFAAALRPFSLGRQSQNTTLGASQNTPVANDVGSQLQLPSAKLNAPPNSPSPRSISDSTVGEINSSRAPKDKYVDRYSIDELTDDLELPSLGPSTLRTGSISPNHLSEPQSPLWPDFDQHHPPFAYVQEREDLSCVDAEHDQPGFYGRHPFDEASEAVAAKADSISRACSLGYGPPLAKHTSSATLKANQPTLSDFHDPQSPKYDQYDPNDRIHAWIDGSPYQPTALEQLAIDLDYLRGAIIYLSPPNT